jgi:hypothetical protein
MDIAGWFTNVANSAQRIYLRRQNVAFRIHKILFHGLLAIVGFMTAGFLGIAGLIFSQM